MPSWGPRGKGTLSPRVWELETIAALPAPPQRWPHQLLGRWTSPPHPQSVCLAQGSTPDTLLLLEVKLHPFGCSHPSVAVPLEGERQAPLSHTPLPMHTHSLSVTQQTLCQTWATEKKAKPGRSSHSGRESHENTDGASNLEWKTDRGRFSRGSNA